MKEIFLKMFQVFVSAFWDSTADTHEMRDEVQSSFPSLESEDRFLAESEFRVMIHFPLK